jgi:hypothetical protein
MTPELMTVLELPTLIRAAVPDGHRAGVGDPVEVGTLMPVTPAPPVMEPALVMMLD